MLAPMSNDVSRLVLGTVQIGSPYGAANLTGLPSTERAIRLLRRAHRSGIRSFDTARGYGEAEERIGAAFNGADGPSTITKLDPLSGLAADASAAEAEAAVEASVNASLVSLKRANLETLLLHRAAHLSSHGGAVWRRLLRLQRAGIIKRLGVSVQNPEEAFTALSMRSVSHIQLPFNLIDQRWREAGIPAAAKARGDVLIHARSIYLQGILASDDSVFWPKVHGVDAEGTLYMLDTLAQLFRRVSIADLCLAYVRGQNWIHGLVIGMETEEQLDRNLALFDSEPLTSAEIANLEPRLPRFPEALLNPALWPRRDE
jgi:aryl-alcohol dehydrogenase-like predicted oxidoreductase